MLSLLVVFSTSDHEEQSLQRSIRVALSSWVTHFSLTCVSWHSRSLDRTPKYVLTHPQFIKRTEIMKVIQEQFEYFSLRTCGRFVLQTKNEQIRVTIIHFCFSSRLSLFHRKDHCTVISGLLGCHRRSRFWVLSMCCQTTLV